MPTLWDEIFWVISIRSIFPISWLWLSLTLLSFVAVSLHSPACRTGDFWILDIPWGTAGTGKMFPNVGNLAPDPSPSSSLFPPLDIPAWPLGGWSPTSLSRVLLLVIVRTSPLTWTTGLHLAECSFVTVSCVECSTILLSFSVNSWGSLAWGLDDCEDLIPLDCSIMQYLILDTDVSPLLNLHHFVLLLGLLLQHTQPLPVFCQPLSRSPPGPGPHLGCLICLVTRLILDLSGVTCSLSLLWGFWVDGLSSALSASCDVVLVVSSLSSLPCFCCLGVITFLSLIPLGVISHTIFSPFLLKIMLLRIFPSVLLIMTASPACLDNGSLNSLSTFILKSGLVWRERWLELDSHLFWPNFSFSPSSLSFFHFSCTLLVYSGVWCLPACLPGKALPKRLVFILYVISLYHVIVSISINNFDCNF